MASSSNTGFCLLPTKTRDQFVEKNIEDDFTKLGFKWIQPSAHQSSPLGEQMRSDHERFFPGWKLAILPTGWSVKEEESRFGDHFSFRILDTEGNKRVNIFRKVATYDNKTIVHFFDPSEKV